MFFRSQRARRWAGVLAFTGTAAAGTACAPAVTTEQEVQLGQDYARQINQQLPLVRDAAINQYINDIGRRMAQAADPRGIPYTFYVVDAEVVNAFAIPGGHVYINRGLIERTENLSELAGVLGHEIAHVTQRHGIEQMQQAENANTLLAVLYGVLLGRQPGAVEQIAIQGGGAAYFARHSRAAENEADALAVQYTTQVGIDPTGIVTFFQKLIEERQRAPSGVEAWFSTHPLTEDRIENTQAFVAEIPAEQRRNLTTNTQAYQQFQARIRQLPPSPQ